MKRFIALLLVFCCYSIRDCVAQPIVEQGSFLPALTGTFTNVTGALPNNSTTTVSLVRAARHLVIKTTTGANACNVTLDGTAASATTFLIDGGASLSLDGLPQIVTVKIFSSAATGSYSILAW